MRAAAQDIAWMIRATDDGGDALQLVRRVAIGGTLALLARRLAPDAAADAFEQAINNGGARDPTLKRVRAMVDQLPDGRDKAEALRRLGEACYGQRMRASAMRMLSEALDLEAPGPPRTWRDEREGNAGSIRTRRQRDRPAADRARHHRTNSHAERRGMIETEVVRWMLAHGERTRAEEVPTRSAIWRCTNGRWPRWRSGTRVRATPHAARSFLARSEPRRRSLGRAVSWLAMPHTWANHTRLAQFRCWKTSACATVRWHW